MTTNLSRAETGTAEVYGLYRRHDWIGQSYKPAKHELGWADFQVRPERAIVCHWQLVMLAFTFSLLAVASSPPAATAGSAEPLPAPGGRPGGKPAPRLVWQATLHAVRAWLCPWARLHFYWSRRTTAPPPPALAALVEHVAHSRALGTPT